ncbi:MAG: hypothetical protein Rubg2KO_23240 [Rubricoccaceae bacterium]
MRAPLISAVAFGLAGGLLGVLAIALLDGNRVEDDPRVLASALAYALPASLSGALVGPVLARCSMGAWAAIAGIGAMVAASFLFGIELAIAGPRLGLSVSTSFWSAIHTLLWMLALAFVLGAVAGWSTWRWLRRE